MKQPTCLVLTVFFLLLSCANVKASSYHFPPLSIILKTCKQYYFCSYQSSKEDSVMLKDKKTGKTITVPDRVYTGSDPLEKDSTFTYLVIEYPDSPPFSFEEFPANTILENRMEFLFRDIRKIFAIKDISKQTYRYLDWVVAVAELKPLQFYGFFELFREEMYDVKILIEYYKTPEYKKTQRMFTDSQAKRLLMVFISKESPGYYDTGAVYFLKHDYGEEGIRFIHDYLKRFLALKDKFDGCGGCAVRAIRELDVNEDVQQVCITYMEEFKKNLDTNPEKYIGQLVAIYDKRFGQQ